MASSMSFLVGLGYARWDPPCAKFHTRSRIPSPLNRVSSNGFCVRSTPLRNRRNAAVSCAAQGAEMLTAVQTQLSSSCFLLVSSSFLVCLVASIAVPRRRLNDISVSERLFFSELVKFLCSVEWQGLQRCAVQVSAVLVLANAFYSDIAPPDPYDTFENVPQDISGGEKRKRIQRPKSRKAERCTQKCLGTCIKGGAGSPGEGPFNIRKPLVVFKEGFRTRQYWYDLILSSSYLSFGCRRNGRFDRVSVDCTVISIAWEIMHFGLLLNRRLSMPLGCHLHDDCNTKYKMRPPQRLVVAANWNFGSGI